MSSLRPITVITGASAGIGVALARVFAQHGHELPLIARREDRLHALAEEIAATGARRPMVIAADLLKAGAGRLIGEAFAAQGAEPQFFVNNAGFGLVGLANARDRDEQLEMIDLNVRALTELSFAFVDSLARHRGGLLNVGFNGRLSARPGHGGLVRYQGVRTVIHGSVAQRAQTARRTSRSAVSGPGADRIRRARRYQRWTSGAEYPDPIGRLCGGGGGIAASWPGTGRWFRASSTS